MKRKALKSLRVSLASFLHTRSARRWIPLLISILIHSALIAGLIYGYRSYRDRSDVVDLPRPHRPDALLVEGAKVGGVEHSDFAGTTGTMTSQSLIPSLPGHQTNIAESPPTLIGPGTTAAGDAEPLIGLPTANSTPSVGVGLDRPSPGPAAKFMGISGDAIRVIFVCDASGSMMDRLPSLEAQLKLSIDQLQPIQWFNVIFFQDSNAVAVSAARLIQALPANQLRVEQLLQGVHAHGTSNPLAAIRLAFSQHPQVIYLLTDGDFEDVADSITDAHIIDEIHRLNSAHHVCVNTILFISDPADLQQDDARAGAAVLKRIAAANGGTFKAVVAEPQ